MAANTAWPDRGASAVALFSGGKDSVYSLIKAAGLGLRADVLLFVDPSFPHPSPHALNFHVVRLLAEDLSIPLVRVKLRRGREADDLASALRRLGAGTLIAGDVLLREHLEWHERVCRMAGVELVEPLYGYDTERLLLEAVGEAGLEFTVVAVGRGMPEELVGVKVDGSNLSWFAELCRRSGADRAGELGEYHTLVNSAPLMEHRFEYSVRRLVDRGPYGKAAVVDVVRRVPRKARNAAARGQARS